MMSGEMGQEKRPHGFTTYHRVHIGHHDFHASSVIPSNGERLIMFMFDLLSALLYKKNPPAERRGDAQQNNSTEMGTDGI